MNKIDNLLKAHIDLKIKNIEYIVNTLTKQHAPLHYIYSHQVEIAVLKDVLEELNGLPELPPGVAYDPDTRELKYKDFTADSFKEMDQILKEEGEEN